MITITSPLQKKPGYAKRKDDVLFRGKMRDSVVV